MINANPWLASNDIRERFHFDVEFHARVVAAHRQAMADGGSLPIEVVAKVLHALDRAEAGKPVPSDPWLTRFSADPEAQP